MKRETTFVNLIMMENGKGIQRRHRGGVTLKNKVGLPEFDDPGRGTQAERGMQGSSGTRNSDGTQDVGLRWDLGRSGMPARGLIQLTKGQFYCFLSLSAVISREGKRQKVRKGPCLPRNSPTFIKTTSIACNK